MPASSSDRYSALSASSGSSTSSSNTGYHPISNHSLSHSIEPIQSTSRSPSTFLPPSSRHLSKLNIADYRSMQSLKMYQQQQEQQQQYSPYYNQMTRLSRAPVARVSPLVICPQLPSLTTSTETLLRKQSQLNSKNNNKDECWLSCEELETIEKRFTDLLQETTGKATPMSTDYQKQQQQQQQRAKSCDRLATDEDEYKPRPILSIGRKSLLDEMEDEDLSSRRGRSPPASIVYDNNTRAISHTRPRSQTPHRLVSSSTPTSILSSADILKVESSYRSIGTQVFACRCLADLYVTTAERLAKLEDWILYQRGLPVWLLNSGSNPKRQSRLSLLIAEHGSGFPIWQDTINGESDVKQARAQHLTFRLSDQMTLAVLRFADLNASKEFVGYYTSIRNDTRYRNLFSTSSFIQNKSNVNNRSSSCGSLLGNKKALRTLDKSSISNPCQFQHITRVQLKDRIRLTTLDQCLMPSHSYSNQHV